MHGIQSLGRVPTQPMTRLALPFKQVKYCITLRILGESVFGPRDEKDAICGMLTLTV
jgi:hypothetical protein